MAIHSTDLVPISAHPPTIIEFFDTPEIANETLVWIKEKVGADKIATWEIHVSQLLPYLEIDRPRALTCSVRHEVA
jgi:PII-like signaling protein